MIKSILIPICEKENSIGALSFAVALGEMTGAEIRALFVGDKEDVIKGILRGKQFRRSGPEWKEQAAAMADEKIKKLMNDVALDYEEAIRGYRLAKSIEFKMGNVAEEILKAEKSSDIVIMGKAVQKRRISFVPVGKTVQQVGEAAYSPVLLVSKGDTPGRDILVAFGPDRNSASALRWSAVFSRVLEAGISVVVSGEQEEEAITLMKTAEDFLRPHGIRPKTIWKKSSLDKAVLSSMEVTGASMVIIGALLKPSLGALFSGDPAREVIMGMDKPVMLCG